MKKVTIAEHCPILSSIQMIGGKWKLLVIYYLSQKTKRFSDLRRDLPEITTKMLTQQLRELEADKLLTRTVFPVVPPKVEYTLTAKGLELIPIIDMLQKWGNSSSL